MVACILLLQPASVPTDPRALYESMVRARYAEFARGLTVGDPSFLQFVDRGFVYIGPEGQKMGAKAWTEGMRNACKRNQKPLAEFTITEIKVEPPNVRVSYIWRYEYKVELGGSPLPRLSESISTDTWRKKSGGLFLTMSKDFRIWHRNRKGGSR